MANVVVSACAYLGDVAPFIPIARRLVEAGHDVTFLVPAGYASILDGEPVTVAAYGLDFSAPAMHEDPEHTRLMRHPMLNGLRLARYWMRRSYLDDIDAADASVRAALVGADCLVSHSTMAMVTAPIATSLGVPTVLGHMFPMLLPTTETTAPIPYNLAAPRFVNRASWSLVRTASARAFGDAEVNALRRRCGLPPQRAVALSTWQDAAATVMLVPEAYTPYRTDWPPVISGGFSIWNGPPNQRLAPELDRYIDAGDAPVAVTLGSSAATNAGERFARIRADLDTRGIRSIVLAGSRANAVALAGQPGVVEFAPLVDVLPRCRAAVVSGALGSFAAALHAGVPVVVHPQLVDQWWHGRRARQLGVGTVAHRTSSVAAAVESVLDDASAANARALAARVALTDGPADVVHAVERVLASSSGP